jgi:transcriptional regulator with XRE-family HTH domain
VAGRDEIQLLVRILRAFLGASQEEMALAASVERSSISRYETGDLTPSPANLERLVTAARLSTHFVETLLLPVIRLAKSGAMPASRTRLDNPGGIEGAILEIVRAGFAELLPSLDAEANRGRATEGDALWERFLSCPAPERRQLIEGSPDFQSWTFSERLCEASARAAAESAETALELAKLGLLAADRAPGRRDQSARYQANAWAYVGNARRVGGGLPMADAAFGMSRTLWREGCPTCAQHLAWRLDDLEASLRRDQRRWPAALALLDRASKMAPPEVAGKLLVNRATVYEQSGELESALVTLDEAGLRVDAEKEPRLRWLIEYNRIVCLCHLGRYEEIESRMAVATAIAVRLDNRLDLLRLLWLQGRIAAGQGRRQEAKEAFERVQTDFVACADPCDTALIALELAILYLEEARFGEVRGLLQPVIATFEAQGIFRESLAAVHLLYQAAEAETATIEQARAVHASLAGSRFSRP